MFCFFFWFHFKADVEVCFPFLYLYCITASRSIVTYFKEKKIDEIAKLNLSHFKMEWNSVKRHSFSQTLLLTDKSNGKLSIFLFVKSFKKEKEHMFSLHFKMFKTFKTMYLSFGTHFQFVQLLHVHMFFSTSILRYMSKCLCLYLYLLQLCLVQIVYI